MINCVSLLNSQNFEKNFLVEQHKLRYHEVILKEAWQDIYTLDNMEFDQYDNLATEYLVAEKDDEVVGVCRLYPTTLPYMLSESFPHLFKGKSPHTPEIFEASRMVLNRSLLSKEERKNVVNELVLAYMERGLQRNIHAYVGFMLPKIWQSTFMRAGWDVAWLGDEQPLADSGEIVRAGMMLVNIDIKRNIQRTTGIYHDVLSFGNGEQYTPRVADWSHNKMYKEKEAA